MIHPPLARRPLGALAAPSGRALLALLPLALGCPSMLPELRNDTGDKVMSPLQPQPPMVNAAPEEPDERDAAQPDAVTGLQGRGERATSVRALSPVDMIRVSTPSKARPATKNPLSKS